MKSQLFFVVGFLWFWHLSHLLNTLKQALLNCFQKKGKTDRSHCLVHLPFSAKSAQRELFCQLNWRAHFAALLTPSRTVHRDFSMLQAVPHHPPFKFFLFFCWNFLSQYTYLYCSKSVSKWVLSHSSFPIKTWTMIIMYFENSNVAMIMCIADLKTLCISNTDTLYAFIFRFRGFARDSIKKKIENLKPKCRRRDNELARSFQVLLFNEKNISLNF